MAILTLEIPAELAARLVADPEAKERAIARLLDVLREETTKPEDRRPSPHKPRDLMAFAGSVVGPGKVGEDARPEAVQDHIDAMRQEWEDRERGRRS